MVNQCIGNWGLNNSVTTESSTVLTAGQTHQLKVQYVQFGRNDLISSRKWREATVLLNLFGFLLVIGLTLGRG